MSSCSCERCEWLMELIFFYQHSRFQNASFCSLFFFSQTNSKRFFSAFFKAPNKFQKKSILSLSTILYIFFLLVVLVSMNSIIRPQIIDVPKWIYDRFQLRARTSIHTHTHTPVTFKCWPRIWQEWLVLLRIWLLLVPLK